MECILVKGTVQLKLLKECFGKNWIPWSSQGMTYFLCVFYKRAIQTHDCDTASKPDNDNH
jgi:hypothetical protein